MKLLGLIAVVLVMSLVALAGSSPPAFGSPQPCLVRVSVSDKYAEANGPSSSAAISGDGSKVAFVSSANNLVDGDRNQKTDIFVKEIFTGHLERISGLSGDPNGHSFGPTLSRSGKFVAFWSDASNLVPNDMNASADVFVKDLEIGTLKRVSIDLSGGEGNDESYDPSISGDGRYVSFHSYASNLDPEDANGPLSDVFSHDVSTGQTKLVSRAQGGGNAGSYGAALSGNGRLIAFWSDASNLVAEDSNNASDVFLFDRKNETMHIVSISSDGIQGDGDSSAPSVSFDGSRVAFSTFAQNFHELDFAGFSDVFVRDTLERSTLPMSQGLTGKPALGSSLDARLSEDGMFLTFSSSANDIAFGDANPVEDVLYRESSFDGSATLAARRANGFQGIGRTLGGNLSGDGQLVVFTSSASNLVDNDNNFLDDVFLTTCFANK